MARIRVETPSGVYEVDDALLYTESDEWVRVEDGVVRVGVTDYAQKELKDIVGVELPEVGSRLRKGEPAAVLESIKATADVYAPVDGEVVEVNERLLDEPELVNRDPYGEGWIFAMRPDDPSQLQGLLTPERYAEKIRREKGG
ncbi:MAG: glycine cleavage system protein GcvH [Desulfurococcales archaeon]|nr:glycine cleavage system protein GcvH [Desulfurococcales archaeon]